MLESRSEVIYSPRIMLQTSREKAYRVRAIRCSHSAGSEEIYKRLREATAPLARSWKKIANARKVGLKVNMNMRTDNIRLTAGRRQELVDADVIRATLRLLRERTDAEIFVIDSSYAPPGSRPGPDFNMREIFQEFRVPYVEAGDPPFEMFRTPGGGLMFSQYQLPASLAETDAFVSLAKLKSHHFMGVTLCLKNLFGLTPIQPHGRYRGYFHHIIRLPYVLADLGMIIQPCLSIIDGLVGQSVREWNGEGRIADALIAGDHPVVTDACGAHLMGHDPRLDWPAPPFRRERSHLAVAAEHGFGTVNLSRIDFESELSPPLADFDTIQEEPPEMIERLRRSACEQALYYRENRDWFMERYGGLYIYLQDGKVVWSGNDASATLSVGELSGDKADHAVWLKLADPEESEGEHFERYEETLAAMS